MIKKIEAPPAPQAEVNQSSELEEMAAALLGTKDPAPEAAPEPEPAPVQRRRRKVVDDFDYGDEDLSPIEETGLSDSKFYRVVGSWRGMKRCLATTAVRGERQGAIKIKFEIAKDGSVTDSQIEDASNETAREISDCVNRQARKIRFPAFAGMDSVEKQAKFVF